MDRCGANRFGNRLAPVLSRDFRGKRGAMCGWEPDANNPALKIMKRPFMIFSAGLSGKRFPAAAVGRSCFAVAGLGGNQIEPK